MAVGWSSKSKIETPVDGPCWPRRSSAWYAAAVLLLAYTLSYVDRSVLTVLIEPIQADFHINDTEIGLLHGFAFVIFYVTLGIPLGLVADQTNRKWLIACSIAIWSAMTAACGLAGSFGQLFAARVGVGIGEAGLSPASYSMLGDYFPPERRSVALGFYTLGIFVGSGLAIFGGGALLALVGSRPFIGVPLLGDIRCWKLIFIVLGAPGLLVAVLAASVREPRRQLGPGAAVEDRTLAAACARCWRQIREQPSVYALHMTGFAFLGVPFNVVVLWARPYLTRHYGLPPAQAAYLVGIALVVFASAGITIGSNLSDRMQADGKTDAPIRVALAAALIICVPLVALLYMPGPRSAGAALAVILFFGASAFGAGPAALQLITPNRMRAAVSALYLLFANLVGLAAGPVLTGALTDYVFRDPSAVGRSAVIVGITSALIAAAAFGLLLRPFRAAVAAASQS
jgi:MFS family permease